MPKHILEDGKEIIAGLQLLGSALNYFVMPEMPTIQGQNNPPAVDVAWMTEENHDFPLMIFEIESKATNSMANNVVKVFGQFNQEFEKPLFFFHIIIKVGRDTSRLETLRTQFGTHNYRYYRLSLGEKTTLVKDIFSQHRRLTRSLNFVSIVSALKDPTWGEIDLNEILLHIEDLGFERDKGSILPSYAYLSKTYPEFQEQFLRFLHKRESASGINKEVDDYSSYFGDEWAYPIHLGLLTAWTENGQKTEYFQKFQQWQEYFSYRSMIGPHFGLSQDYDTFIYSGAGELFALIAALMHELPEAGLYIAKQCHIILEGMQSWKPSISFVTALWMLHIAASSKLAGKEFEYARKYINARGGIPMETLYAPPSFTDIYEDIEDDEELGRWHYTPSSLIQIPTLQDFKKGNKSKALIPDERRSKAIALGINTLIKDDSHFDWPLQLIPLLTT